MIFRGLLDGWQMLWGYVTIQQEKHTPVRILGKPVGIFQHHVCLLITPPKKTNMDTQNSHIWQKTHVKEPSFLVSMLDFGGKFQLIKPPQFGFKQHLNCWKMDPLDLWLCGLVVYLITLLEKIRTFARKVLRFRFPLRFWGRAEKNTFESKISVAVCQTGAKFGLEDFNIPSKQF